LRLEDVDETSSNHFTNFERNVQWSSSEGVAVACRGEDIAILGLRARTQRKVSFKYLQRLILSLEVEAVKNDSWRRTKARKAWLPDRGEHEHLVHHLDVEELVHHLDGVLVHHLVVEELRLHLVRGRSGLAA